jgi:hypothetical protein
MKYFLVWSACFALSAFAQVQTAWRPALLRRVGIDQKMGAQIPINVPFNDEAGDTVTLSRYLATWFLTASCAPSKVYP